MSYRSVLNVSNGRPSNPKLTLKINSLRIKRKAQNLTSWMLSKYAFKIGRKKRKWFFDHSTTLSHFLQASLSIYPSWFIWKWDFIHKQIKLIFQMNGCASGLHLMERLKSTRKWAIKVPITSFFFLFSHLVLHITPWTSAKKTFDLDKMHCLVHPWFGMSSDVDSGTCDYMFRLHSSCLFYLCKLNLIVHTKCWKGALCMDYKAKFTDVKQVR